MKLFNFRQQMRDLYECQILIDVVTIWLTVCKGHGQWTLPDPWLYVCVWDIQYGLWFISYES